MIKCTLLANAVQLTLTAMNLLCKQWQGYQWWFRGTWLLTSIVFRSIKMLLYLKRNFLFIPFNSSPWLFSSFNYYVPFHTPLTYFEDYLLSIDHYYVFVDLVCENGVDGWRNICCIDNIQLRRALCRDQPWLVSIFTYLSLLLLGLDKPQLSDMTQAPKERHFLYKSI